MIGNPICDVAWILCHQCGVTCFYVDPVHIKNFRISLVVLYQHVIRVILQVVYDGCLYLWQWGKIFYLSALHINGYNMVIFIPAEVFNIEDMAVTLPEVTGKI